MAVQNEAGDDIDVWVVQPKTLWAGGSITPERWNTPQEEVRQWVFTSSLA